MGRKACQYMSQGDVEWTLGRLLTDSVFRRDFFDDPGGACLLLGLQLAPSEIDALLRIPRPALVALGGRLDDRICRVDGRRPGGSVREECWRSGAGAPVSGRRRCL
jgi:hypothetical protein